MAKYNITSLNYIASGTSRSYINMDICLGYELVDYIHFLCAETRTSGYQSIQDQKNQENLSALSVDIGTEQGEGFWAKTNYI